METQIDSYPVASLPDAFGVARSNIYKWFEALGIQPQKIEGKACINADQFEQMKAMSAHLEGGGTLANFGDGSLSRVSQDKPDRLARQDNKGMETAIVLSGVLDAIATKVAAVIDGDRQPADPLARYRALEEIAAKGWLLPTSEIAALLGRKSLPSGESFDRYGFRFVRVGKNGSESAWRVEKP